MAENVRVHVKDSCVDCKQCVHPQIHRNVSVKLVTPEILYVDAKMWTNAQKILADPEQDVSMRREDINVNVQREQREILTFRVVVELLQDLNVSRMRTALDNYHAKPLFVSILALPSLADKTQSAFPKTMQLGADVKLDSQKMMMENASLCVKAWFVELTQNAYLRPKDLHAHAQREQVEIPSQEETAYQKRVRPLILAPLQCLAYLENVGSDVTAFLAELVLFVTLTHCDVSAKTVSSETVTFCVCLPSFHRFANLDAEEAVTVNTEHQINVTVTAEPRETLTKDAQVKLINVRCVETMQNVSRKEAKMPVNVERVSKAVRLLVAMTSMSVTLPDVEKMLSVSTQLEVTTADVSRVTVEIHSANVSQKELRLQKISARKRNVDLMLFARLDSAFVKQDLTEMPMT
jgi:hypothetical protein